MRTVHYLLSTLLASSPMMAGAATLQANQPAEATPERAVAQDRMIATNPGADRRRNGRSRPTNPLDLLPLIQVETPGEPGAFSARLDNPSSVGGYVRFYVCQTTQCGTPGNPVAPDDRDYANEHRSWISRVFADRTYTRILTVKLSVSQPNVSTTSTLAAASMQSSLSRGESWNSEVNGRHFLTPYFRVDPDTVVSLQVGLNASTQSQVHITGLLLDVVGRAARLVQPTGPLVTSLNSDRFRQTSEFVDQTISNLFAQNLAEQTANQFSPNEWSGKELVTITAGFPMGRNLLQRNWQSTIGTWRVFATSPVVSIFSLVPMDVPTELAQTNVPANCEQTSVAGLQACRAFASLTVERVLGLDIAENLTLRQALTSDTGISAETARLLSASGDAKSESARRLCGLVAAKAERLGLNHFDAAAAVWAYVQDAQIGRDQREALLGTGDTKCSAATLAHRLGLR